MQGDVGEAEDARPPRKKRIGVIGSLVWDVIHGRDTREHAVEEWGGITYTMSALDAALPEDWEIVPIMMVGEDLAVRAHGVLRTRKRRAPQAGRMAGNDDQTLNKSIDAGQTATILGEFDRSRSLPLGKRQMRLPVR